MPSTLSYDDDEILSEEEYEEYGLSELSENCADFKPSTQNVIVGIYLIIAGILTVLGNSAIIGAFMRFRRLLRSPYRLLILHLCLSGIGMALLGGFLLSGTSSLAGRWLFGDNGCQYYAFAGFFFGNANLTFVFVMTVIRCFIGMKNPPISVTNSRIKKCVYIVWMWSLFWAVCPLLGWSNYDYEPSKTTCTINWMQNDFSYVSYILCMASLVFLIPILGMITSIFISYRDLNNLKSANSASDTTLNAVGQLKGIKMCVVLLIILLLCWSGYALLCLYVVFYPPENVPENLSVLPPLFAKMATVLNPIVVCIYDDELRQGAYSCIFCKEIPEQLETSPETTPMAVPTSEE